MNVPYRTRHMSYNTQGMISYNARLKITAVQKQCHYFKVLDSATIIVTENTSTAHHITAMSTYHPPWPPPHPILVPPILTYPSAQTLLPQYMTLYQQYTNPSHHHSMLHLQYNYSHQATVITSARDDATAKNLL